MDITRRDVLKLGGTAAVAGAGGYALGSDTFDPCTEPRERYDDALHDVQRLEAWLEQWYAAQPENQGIYMGDVNAFYDDERVTIAGEAVREAYENNRTPEAAFEAAGGMQALHGMWQDPVTVPLLFDDTLRVDIIHLREGDLVVPDGLDMAVELERIGKTLQDAVPYDIDVAVETRQEAAGDSPQETLQELAAAYEETTHQGYRDSIIQLYLVERPEREVLGGAGGWGQLNGNTSVVGIPREYTEPEDRAWVRMAAVHEALGHTAHDLSHTYARSDVMSYNLDTPVSVAFGDRSHRLIENFRDAGLDLAYAVDGDAAVLEAAVTHGVQDRVVARDDFLHHLDAYLNDLMAFDLEPWNLARYTGGHEGGDGVTEAGFRRSFGNGRTIELVLKAKGTRVAAGHRVTGTERVDACLDAAQQ